eukprot:388926_1
MLADNNVSSDDANINEQPEGVIQDHKQPEGVTKLYSSKVASDFHQYLEDEEYDSECLKDDLQDEMPFFVEHIIFTNPSIFNTETQKNELLTNVKQLLNNNDKTYTLQNSCTTETKLDASSGSDNDIEELYISNTFNANTKTIANDSDLKNNQPAKPVKPKKTNGPFKILRNIHNKRAWFNAKKLVKDYQSIDSNIIPSLSLKELNNNSFRKQYEYENRSQSTHWLIPNIILVGEYPNRFVQLLIKDNFTTFVSLDEWKHDDYIDEMKKCCKNMDSIELIAFTIQDFRIVDDKTTAKFVAMLTQKILNIKSGNKIYLHCYGGHGRTGLISSLLLQAIYGMNSEISLKFIYEIHKVRHPYCGDDRMPESWNQREQIKRLHYTMMKIYKHYNSK